MRAQERQMERRQSSISFGSRSPKYTNAWIYVMLEEGNQRSTSRFLTDGASRRTGFRVHVGGWNEFCLRHDELKSFSPALKMYILGVLSTDGEFKAMGVGLSRGDRCLCGSTKDEKDEDALTSKTQQKERGGRV